MSFSTPNCQVFWDGRDRLPTLPSYPRSPITLRERCQRRHCRRRKTPSVPNAKSKARSLSPSTSVALWST